MPVVMQPAFSIKILPRKPNLIADIPDHDFRFTEGPVVGLPDHISVRIGHRLWRAEVVQVGVEDFHGAARAGRCRSNVFRGLKQRRFFLLSTVFALADHPNHVRAGKADIPGRAAHGHGDGIPLGKHAFHGFPGELDHQLPDPVAVVIGDAAFFGRKNAVEKHALRVDAVGGVRVGQLDVAGHPPAAAGEVEGVGIEIDVGLDHGAPGFDHGQEPGAEPNVFGGDGAGLIGFGYQISALVVQIDCIPAGGRFQGPAAVAVISVLASVLARGGAVFGRLDEPVVLVVGEGPKAVVDDFAVRGILVVADPARGCDGDEPVGVVGVDLGPQAVGLGQPVAVGVVGPFEQAPGSGRGAKPVGGVVGEGPGGGRVEAVGDGGDVADGSNPVEPKKSSFYYSL